MESSYNILIVDDVSENIKVAISILKNDAYSFSFALSGEEALEIIKTKKFDLILLDIMMPGIDGYEVCQRIKNTPAIQDTPIIFLTAKVDIESIEKGFALGAIDYVTKPFHPRELKARVKNHLELHRSKELLKLNNINLANKMIDSDKQHFADLEHAQNETLLILSQLMESRSEETATHVQRVYKKPWTLEEVKDFIIQNSGRKFDPALVNIFTENLEDFRKILEKT